MGERKVKVKCPDCGGDGLETCHNPDHGLISALSFTDMGRLGCPVCGHDPKGKVKRGGVCDTCNGEKEIDEDIARDFCLDYGYDFNQLCS